MHYNLFPTFFRRAAASIGRTGGMSEEASIGRAGGYAGDESNISCGWCRNNLINRMCSALEAASISLIGGSVAADIFLH